MSRQLLFALGMSAAMNAAVAGAQTIAIPKVVIGNTVRLTTFRPADSLFINPTQTSFVVTHNKTISGAATEYRVSRFADFRDAAWRPYNPHPSLTVPGNWFQPTSSLGLRELTLHFQVRNRNPNAGRPISLVDRTVQPDFFFSDVLVGHLRIVFAG
jgi:hypothetical protein